MQSQFCFMTSIREGPGRKINRPKSFFSYTVRITAALTHSISKLYHHQLFNLKNWQELRLKTTNMLLQYGLNKKLSGQKAYNYLQ